MAELQTIEGWGDARPYLDNLKQTILADVCPLLDLPEGAPFAVSREVFCYIDHLGHLYSGRGPGQVGERFLDYLKHVMNRVDSNYGKRAAEIYQMYRNGPVHEFKPKVLENKKGQCLGWLCYQGARNNHNLEISGEKMTVTHLELVKDPGHDKSFCLPVSMVCLIMDLLSSIDEFQKMGPEDERITAWNRAARELIIPRPSDFSDFTVP
jgi:hypothetical protein